MGVLHWESMENGLENDLFGGCPLGQCSLAVVHLTIWPFPTGTQWEMALRMTCLVVVLFGDVLSCSLARAGVVVKGLRPLFVACCGP